MSNKYVMSIVFIVLLSVQLYFLESNNEFLLNNVERDKHGHDLSLRSLQLDKVCTKDHNVGCHKDQLGFEAISMLHSQIDDDHNGNLDLSESQDFFKADLNRDTYSYESHFHKNDGLVSVQDLWNYWVHSEVHNWTVDDVIEWLDSHVELGQYAEQFRRNEVDGAILPRLACSMHNPLYNILGIKNVKHKQKISIKATDIVLFGIPKNHRSIFSDTLFIFSIILALAGCGLGYRQHKLAKLQLQIISNDLRNLQSAEDALKRFQAQLEESRKKQREEEDKRDELKRMLVNKEFKASGSEIENGDQKIRSVHEELIQTRLSLMEAEFQLEECRRSSIPDLQQWLQLTYEIESKYIEERGNEVFKRLQEAKKMCESMKRQKLKLLSSIRSPTKSPEFEASDVKQALEEIKVDMEERAARWKEIERITSFNITTNPGIPYLNTLLRSAASSVLSIPGMITSPSMSKISTVPGHLNAYPIMTNLLKAGMQLSAVGINTCMIDRPVDTAANLNGFDILPNNLSHASLMSLDGNGHPPTKFLKQNSLKSFTPPYHLTGLQRYPHKSMPTFCISPMDSPSEQELVSDGNINNNFNSNKPPNNCNGHSALKKETKMSLTSCKRKNL